MRKKLLARLVGLLFPAIQGALPNVPFNGALPDQTGLNNALLGVNPWPAVAYNAATNTASFTASPGQIMAAESTVLACTGAAGAGVALTLPTVAALLAALTLAQGVVGSAVTLRVVNTTTQTITMTTAAGWTLNGTMTIATGAFRDFFVTITGIGASAAATLQDIGSGAGTE